MNYPIEKYRFYTRTKSDGIKQVIAVSSYAGRTVKGYANCSLEDEFSIETGKELAAARCNLKVAQKRYARALRKQSEAFAEVTAKAQHLEKMNSYVCDSAAAFEKARVELDSLVGQL
jgi:hypothetical protein